MMTTNAISKPRVLAVLYVALTLGQCCVACSEAQRERRQQDMVKPILVQCRGYQYYEQVRLNKDLYLQYGVTVDANSPSGGTFSAQLVYDGLGWLGFGISKTGTMLNSLALVGLPEEDRVQAYLLSDRKKRDIEPLPESQQISVNATIVQDESTTTLSFTRLIREPNHDFDINLYQENIFVFAYGHDNEFNKHKDKGVLYLNLRPCIPTPTYTEDSPSKNPSPTLSSSSEMPSTESTVVEDQPNKTMEANGTPNMAIESAESEERQYQARKKTIWIAHGVMGTLTCGVLLPLTVGSSLIRGYYVNDDPTSNPERWLSVYQGCNILVLIFAAMTLILALLGPSNKTTHYIGTATKTSMSKHRVGGFALFVVLAFHTLVGLLRYYFYYESQKTDATNEATSASVTLPGMGSGDESMVSEASQTCKNKQWFKLRKEKEMIHSDTFGSVEITAKVEEGCKVSDAQSTLNTSYVPTSSIVLFTKSWDTSHCFVGVIITIISWWHCGVGLSIYEDVFRNQEGILGTNVFWGLTGTVAGLIGFFWLIQMTYRLLQYCSNVIYW